MVVNQYDSEHINQILPPLTIETLVNGGSGLARYEDRVVFIPHVVAGDVVHAKVVRSKKKYFEAQLIDLLQSGHGRRQPPCPVAGECGGCQWQHLEYKEQLAWKEKLFVDTLRHHVSIEPSVVRPILPSSKEWHYRSRVQIKCFNLGTRLATGFYRPRSRFVVNIDSCPIMDDRLNHLLKELKSLIGGSVFAGFIPQIDLSVDDVGKTAVVVHYLGVEQKKLFDLLRHAALDADIFVQFGSKKSLQAVAGDGILELRVDVPPISLNYRVGSFAQINLQQNKALVDLLVSMFPWSNNHQVLELYCGMGNLSFPLARRVGHLVGVEESGSSIDIAHKNKNKTGITNLEFVAAPVERVLPACLKNNRFDVVVLDPPRIGAYSVLKFLAESGVPNIIYVSCDPQTLARDLQPLIHAGYHLVSSQPVDMFPQTHHCESITCLQKHS